MAITVLLLVPFVSSALWSANRTRLERESEVREQAGAVAATAAAYFNQYLHGLDSMASALSRNPSVMALDRESCDRLFADVLRDQPLILNLIVTDRGGDVKGSGLPVRGGSLAPAAAQRMRDEVFASGKSIATPITTGVVTGKPTVVLAYPVRDTGGNVVGVLGLGLNLTELQTLFNDVPLPENSVITMTDAQGRVLARSRDADRYIGKPASNYSTPMAPKDVPRTQMLEGLDGVRRFYGNAVVERGPWLLSVGIPTRVALERAAPLFRRNLAIASSAIIVVLLLALFGSSLIAGGISRIHAAVQRIAHGDLSAPGRSPVPNRELLDLQESFITMAANLREAHTALDRQIEQERKMREALQSLQRQVVRQERLAAVGVLVSGVAHELNNPLQAILGTAELLERAGDLTPDALQEVAFVKTQSGRAREIIRNLSRFSSQHSGAPTLVDLGEVVAEVVQLRRRDLDNSSIALDVQLDTARKVSANFTEVEQVVLNFVINAQQSIEADGRMNGRILIRVFDAGKKVRLEVQDDGPGVLPEDEPKLFQPFFTTKPVGKGTGLGLSVSYGIIESYGGAIGHHGNDWRGATFFFELPASEQSLRPPAASTRSTPKPDDRSPLLQRPVSRGV